MRGVSRRGVLSGAGVVAGGLLLGAAGSLVAPRRGYAEESTFNGAIDRLVALADNT